MEHLRDLLKRIHQPWTRSRNDIWVDIIDTTRRDSRDVCPTGPHVDLLRIAAVRWLFRQDDYLRIGCDDTLDTDRRITAVVRLCGEDVATASVRQHIVLERSTA